jgi:hypothetical protein
VIWLQGAEALHTLASRWTSGSSNCRPMSRFTAYTVFCGFVTACRLAGSPTSRSPLSVNATTEGVVRAPSAFSSTRGFCRQDYKFTTKGMHGEEHRSLCAHTETPMAAMQVRRGRNKVTKSATALTLPSITATHELVVPRSMPMTSLPDAGRTAVELHGIDTAKLMYKTGSAAQSPTVVFLGGCGHAAAAMHCVQLQIDQDAAEVAHLRPLAAFASDGKPSHACSNVLQVAPGCCILETCLCTNRTSQVLA